MIRIGGVLSRAATRVRFLAAGSGLATTDIRIVLAAMVEAAMKVACVRNQTSTFMSYVLQFAAVKQSSLRRFMLSLLTSAML